MNLTMKHRQYQEHNLLSATLALFSQWNTTKQSRRRIIASFCVTFDSLNIIIQSHRAAYGPSVVTNVDVIIYRVYRVWLLIRVDICIVSVALICALVAFRHFEVAMVSTPCTQPQIRSFRRRFVRAHQHTTRRVNVCVSCVTFSPDDLFVPLVTISACTCQLINASFGTKKKFPLLSCMKMLIKNWSRN